MNIDLLKTRQGMKLGLFIRPRMAFLARQEA